jgi:hypothetical protein
MRVRSNGVMFYTLTIMSCYHIGVSSFSSRLGWIGFKGSLGNGWGRSG